MQTVEEGRFGRPEFVTGLRSLSGRTSQTPGRTSDSHPAPKRHPSHHRGPEDGAQSQFWCQNWV